MPFKWIEPYFYHHYFTNFPFTPYCSRPCGLWAKSWGSVGMQMGLPAWQHCVLKRPCPSSAFKRTLKSEVSGAMRKRNEQDPTQSLGHCEEIGRTFDVNAQRKRIWWRAESHFLKYYCIHTPATFGATWFLENPTSLSQPNYQEHLSCLVASYCCPTWTFFPSLHSEKTLELWISYVTGMQLILGWD